MADKFNFTYLFGAGASAEIIPVVKGFGERWREFNSAILSKKAGFENIEKINRHILNMINSHASFDTYAKKMFLQGSDSEIKDLKIQLTLFLNWLQCDSLKRDKRYDLFFASILDNKNAKIPDNIKILSYNYDWQVELSLLSFQNNIDRLDQISKYLRVYPSYNWNTEQKNLEMVKINGSASHFYNDGSNSVLCFDYKSGTKNLYT